MLTEPTLRSAAPSVAAEASLETVAIEVARLGCAGADPLRPARAYQIIRNRAATCNTRAFNIAVSRVVADARPIRMNGVFFGAVGELRAPR